MNKIKQRAFSLIELSVSLVIIAIIMSIVAGSIKMVTAARLNNARSLTSRSPVLNTPGLVAWYETSRLESFKTSEIADGAQITAWYDTSPNSVTKKFNTVTRTASAAVTYVADGISKIPSIYFDGTAAGLTLSDFYQGSTSQNTIFIVAKPAALSSNASMIGSGCGKQAASLLISSTALSIALSNTVSASSTITTNTDYIISAYYDGASSKIFLNDAANMLGGSVLNAGTANVLTGLSIGSCSSTFFSGWISEVIIFNRPLQNQERKDVMNYLNQKYSLTISGI